MFDNASHTLAPLKPLEGIARFVLSTENVGYWSALNWSLENAGQACGREFAYVHPIESDLVLYKLERLALAQAFLDSHLDIETVRTQEFSVRNRQRYFKNGGSLFPVRRSRVADYNGVTEEKVTFEPANGFPDVFLSNWHAKVPALHRFAALKSVFSELAAQEKLSELNFMRLMHGRASETAILDEGIYYTVSYNPKQGFVSGSYSTEAERSGLGYRASRFDRIEAVSSAVEVTATPTAAHTPRAPSRAATTA